MNFGDWFLLYQWEHRVFRFICKRKPQGKQSVNIRVKVSVASIVSLFLASASEFRCKGKIPMSRTENVVFDVDSWHASFRSNSDLKADREILKDLLEGKALPDFPSRYFNPIAFSLGKIDWKIFGTGTFDRDFLTFKNDSAEKLRQIEFVRLITATSSKHDLLTRHLIYYGRSEFGQGERGHYNFLIGEQGTETVSADRLAATMQRIWTTGAFRRGIGIIEPFRKHLHLEAVLYQSKYEFDSNGNLLIPAEIRSPMLGKFITRKSAGDVLLKRITENANWQNRTNYFS
jgi:hypothetical protein